MWPYWFQHCNSCSEASKSWDGCSLGTLLGVAWSLEYNGIKQRYMRSMIGWISLCPSNSQQPSNPPIGLPTIQHWRYLFSNMLSHLIWCEPTDLLDCVKLKYSHVRFWTQASAWSIHAFFLMFAKWLAYQSYQMTRDKYPLWKTNIEDAHFPLRVWASWFYGDKCMPTSAE